MSEKLVKIGRKPRVIEPEHRFGRSDGLFYVLTHKCFVPEELWLKFEKFQAYDPASDDVDGQLSRGVPLKDLQAPALDAVLALNPMFSNVWEFNGLVKEEMAADGKSEDSEYIRSFAICGDKGDPLMLWTAEMDVLEAEARAEADAKNLKDDPK